MSKSVLFATTAFALALAAVPAWAQDQGAVQTPPADEPVQTTAPVTPAPEEAGEDEVEAVVVTGTRLRIRDYVAPSPVTTITSETLTFSGATNVTDFLQDIPALTGSVDSQDNANAGSQASAGINLLDIRNLGTDRSLVLVDGRRHVAGQAGSAAVDTNTIPIGLIERVESLTGGSSAVYGADAVSGVVNFILRRDFEGVDLRLQTGTTDEGGATANFGSVLFGENFANDRGNATLAYEFSLTDPLNRDDRELTRLGRRLSLVNNPAERAVPGDDPAIPDRVFLNDIRYIDSALEGAVYTTAFAGPSRSGVSFTGDGRPWQDGLFLGGFTMQGGSGTPTDIFQTQLIPGLDRHSVNGTFSFELTPRMRVFADAKYVNAQTQFVSQPTFDYSLYVPIDNPFIPASIRADATRPGNLGTVAGIQEFNVDIFGQAPNFVGPGVLLGRDNLDLGELVRDIERETYRTVIGVEGDLSDNLRYEASYVYGKLKETNVTSGDRINERFFAAIDAVRAPNGEIVCRSTLNPSAVPLGNYPGFGSNTQNPATFGSTFTPGANSGCVPINIFGQNISAEGRAFINNTATDRAEVQQHVANAFLAGDSERFFNLQGGPLAFVIGAEYRKEQSETEPDRIAALSAELGEDLSWLGEGTSVSGEFDVKEVFAELNAPLLRDVRFARALSVQGAYRYSDYSTSGGADTWNVGGSWRITDSVMLRAARARAVRAPNISDLFTPQVQTFALLADPCDQDNVALGRDPATRLANCTAALRPLNLTPATFDDTSSSSAEGVVGGNPDLQPEEADTTTYGVVLTPTFVPGLQFAIDYYNIELSNAINLFSAQNTVNNCFDLPQPNAFCEGLTRQASPNRNFNGRILSFQQFALNVASYVTSGYDFSVRYDLRPERFGIQRDIGRFNFALIGNKLEELTFIEVPGAAVDEDVGESESPEWQVNFDATWFFRNLTVNYGYSWTDETIRFPDTYEADPDYLADEFKNFSAQSVHDLQARYTFADRYTVYAGVNNLTNQEPDLGALQSPVSIRGRFFYVGGSVRLGPLSELLGRR